LLGALDSSSRTEEKQKLTELLAKKRRENVRIDALLMHPANGEFRERVENRSRAAVARDIQSSLAEMIQSLNGNSTAQDTEERTDSIFGLDNVKLYPGVITAFSIFTKRAVLLNTSTLTGPVYENVAIIIRDVDDANSIYKKFRASHFDEPWKSEKTVPLTRKLLQELVVINFADDAFRFREGNWPTTIVDERTSVPAASESGVRDRSQQGDAA